jgi:hypothetical protein
MADHLYQDAMNERGYVAKPTRPKPSEAAVALTGDGRCVFGDPRTARSTYAKPGSKLMYYDDEVERQRRLVCDTALGQLMLDNPKFAQPAVNTVSQGITRYWQGLRGRLDGTGGAFKKIVETDGKYVSAATSFGRLPVAQPPATAVDPFRAQIEIWLATLGQPDLPRIMNLHDVFLKIYCGNESTGLPPLTPNAVAARYGLREDWYDQEARGRSKPKSVAGSELPGLITDDFTIPSWVMPLERCGVHIDSMRVEKRNRGTDMFMIEAAKMRPEFRKVLGEHNLVFAASASGTTSTLLAAAKTFGLPRGDEAVKQYLMACVAYLVGGGMHTCHEVFYTGGKAGPEYTPGKYLGMLPSTFTGSRLYERWATEFWDVVRPDRPSPR